MIWLIIWYAVSLVTGLTALLPDPFALNRDWTPALESKEKKFHDRYIGALRMRNWATHMITTGFTIFCLVLMMWNEISSHHTLTDDKFKWLIPVCMVAGIVVVLWAQDLAGWAGSSLLIWVVSAHFGRGIDELSEDWLRSRAIPIALIASLLLLGFLCSGLIKWILLKIQYSITSAFAISFSLAFMEKGWRHYANTGGTEVPFWEPAIATLIMMGVIIVVQEWYIHHGYGFLSKFLEPVQPSPGEQAAAVRAKHVSDTAL